MPIASTDLVASNRSNANQTTECSAMRTARPAARPPHPFFELRAQPFDMLPPCLIFLDGDGPADPLVARERRYVFPSRQCLRVGRERFSEIGGKIMYNSSGDLNGCHRLKDQLSDTRVQLGFLDYVAYPDRTAFLGDYFRIAGFTSSCSRLREPMFCVKPDFLQNSLVFATSVYSRHC
jgi:hypothetical protein